MNSLFAPPGEKITVKPKVDHAALDRARIESIFGQPMPETEETPSRRLSADAIFGMPRAIEHLDHTYPNRRKPVHSLVCAGRCGVSFVHPVDVVEYLCHACRSVFDPTFGVKPVAEVEPIERTPKRRVAELARGMKVHAADRDNFGRILDIAGGYATVLFVNPDSGASATPRLPLHLLSPVGR